MADAQLLQGLSEHHDYRMYVPQTAEEIEAETVKWCEARDDPDDKRFEAFRGCIAAADGTLIPMQYLEPEWVASAFRTRKVLVY